MGSVDQADAKAYVLNLTRQRVQKWYRKQLLFCIETAIINAYCNYNLDTGRKSEGFKDWNELFISELLDMSPNYRSYKTPRKHKQKFDTPESGGMAMKKLKLSHKKQETPKRLRRSQGLPYGTATKAGLNCPLREKLSAGLRFTATEGSGNKPKPVASRRKCSFCGKDRTMHSCAGCKQAFCMAPPCNLIIPMSNPPRKFPSNGPFCWQRVHGFNTFDELMNE